MADKDKDKLLMGPPVKEGSRDHHCLRTRGCNVEAGTVRLIKEGEAMHGEPIVMSGTGPTYTIDPEEQESPSESTSGPARVANPAYDQGWERLWGKPVVGQA